MEKGSRSQAGAQENHLLLEASRFPPSHPRAHVHKGSQHARAHACCAHIHHRDHTALLPPGPARGLMQHLTTSTGQGQGEGSGPLCAAHCHPHPHLGPAGPEQGGEEAGMSWGEPGTPQHCPALPSLVLPLPPRRNIPMGQPGPGGQWARPPGRCAKGTHRDCQRPGWRAAGASWAGGLAGGQAGHRGRAARPRAPVADQGGSSPDKSAGRRALSKSFLCVCV